jgi:alpha-glucuronidase
MKRLLAIVFVLTTMAAYSEDGYDLWMRYKPVENKSLLASYRLLLKQVSVKGNSSTIQVLKEELMRASTGMLQQPINFTRRRNSEPFCCKQTSYWRRRFYYLLQKYRRKKSNCYQR